MHKAIRIPMAVRITFGTLRQEMGSLRVIMGYLLGMTFLHGFYLFLSGISLLP